MAWKKMSLAVLLLLLLPLPTPGIAQASYDPMYVSEVHYGARERDSHRHSRFPSELPSGDFEYDYFISPLNFRAVQDRILVGAADSLYLLDTTLTETSQLEWSTTPTFTCTDSNNMNYICRNHIRVYERIPSNSTLLFVCGTQSTVQPQCRTVEIIDDEFGNVSVAVNTSSGIISLHPDLPGFGEFRESDDLDSVYFTAGFFEGPSGIDRHFSISYQNVSLDDMNSLQVQEEFRTIETEENWLNYPTSFVDFRKVNYPPRSAPTATPDEYQFYYVFLRENLYDTRNGIPDIIYTRVVRICRNDRGSIGTEGGSRFFTTYMKARIFCEREVASRTQSVGSINYQYNDMRSVVFNDEERPYFEDGMRVRMMYGAFSGPLIGPVGTAICGYRADNNGDFDQGIFEIFREDFQVQDANGAIDTVANVNTECGPTSRSDEEATNKVLISRNIKQVTDDPLLVLEGVIVTQMILDSVCVVRRQDPTRCVNQTVFFLGTDTGRILKVVFALSTFGGVATSSPVVVEDIRLDDSNSINQLQIQEISGTKYLFANTWSSIYRLPLERCGNYSNCRACVGSRDPYCVWNTTSEMCEVSTLSATGEADGIVSSNLLQRISEDVDETFCPAVTDPTVTDPTGTNPTVTDPTGTNPTVTDPTGTDPTGTDPTGTDPTGTNPTATDPTASDSTATDPNTTDPNPNIGNLAPADDSDGSVSKDVFGGVVGALAAVIVVLLVVILVLVLLLMRNKVNKLVPLISHFKVAKDNNSGKNGDVKMHDNVQNEEYVKHDLSKTTEHEGTDM